MKAMILETYGPDATFVAAERDMPKAEAGEVLVKVAATSVNTVDTMIRQLGQEQLPLSPDLPAILGMDFAGTIEAVGDGVTGFEVGDEVYGCAGGLLSLQGALAEYIPADARLVAHKPKSLSMKQAAALPLVGITAYEGLTRAGVGARQKVLVQGGSGGVGHVAVQLAKHFGADVYATGAGGAQTPIIEGYGATAINFMTEAVSDYVEQYTGGAGFDLVFDSVGGANMTNSFEAAKLNGHVASTVALVDIDLSPAHFKGLSLHIIFMLIPMMHDVRREKHGAILTELAKIVDEGGLKPLLDPSNFTLAQAGEAHAKLESGAAIGKVVISV
ncbi:MAG: zinc-dependent alcohol dehydrogenase family protein [Pseudomonadota bacterium]